MSAERTAELYASRARSGLQRLRERTPLVNHITNFVVMNETANITIAAGARPIMGHALEEAEELTALSSALLINAGNVTYSDWNETMVRCALLANERGIPVILDPVGYGATATRTRMTNRILREAKVDVIRGNRGEIGRLSGLGGEVSGVDAVGEQPEAALAAKTLAREYGAVVAVGGARDVVSDGESVWEVASGHELLTALTGTGCMATSVIAAWLAATEADTSNRQSSYFEAALFALSHYRIAAAQAGRTPAGSRGPGSFLSSLIDAVYNLSPAELERSFPSQPVEEKRTDRSGEVADVRA
ncbi:MAG: hydroxyethylthiazole kinase [Spirochaetaceae bacterium]